MKPRLTPADEATKARLWKYVRSRRAPTPSGLYGCKCLYCGDYFGGSRPDQKFCSQAHNNAYHAAASYARRRRLDRDIAEYQRVVLGDISLSDMRPPPTRSMSDAADPRAGRPLREDDEEG